jgi:hypothetical protein
MVKFNFSFAPGTSLQQMIGFEMAGRVWSSFLSDSLTVNIHVGVANDLPGMVIGGALPGIRASQSYKNVFEELESDRSSLDDVVAVDNLSSKADYEAWFDEFDRKNGKNSGEKAKTKEISLTRANAKALGLLSEGANDLDGVIVFGGLTGSNFRWNYDFTRSSSAPGGTLDFLSTAMHEIAHILGFVSGVDKPGWLNSAAPDKEGMEQYKRSLQTRITYTTPLDLFRFSRVAGTSINDLSYGSIGSDKFFSINGGKTAIAQFSTGLDRTLGGDGFQASHWKNGTTNVGIMGPTLTPQEQSWISTLDLRAMDVMGWDLRSGSTNLRVDLSALQSQAEQALAQRLGVSVSWLHQNAETAAQQLGRDRSADIDDMIQKSEVYGWGTKTTTTGSTPPPPPNPWRQVINLLEQQVVYGSFATLDSEFSVAEEAAVGSQSEIKLMVSSAQDSDIRLFAKTLKIPFAGSLHQFEVEMPIPETTTVLPEVERTVFSPVKFGDISSVITPGRIDMKKWLEGFEDSIRFKRLKNLTSFQQDNATKNKDWEALEWTDV